MNTRLFQVCCLAGLLTAPIWTLAGCGKEVSHTETIKTNPDGTVKKQETTVTQNPDGSQTIDKSKTETIDH